MSQEEQMKLNFRNEITHKKLPKPKMLTVYENPYRFVEKKYLDNSEFELSINESLISSFPLVSASAVSNGRTISPD
jgi:hypothetical protein